MGQHQGASAARGSQPTDAGRVAVVESAAQLELRRDFDASPAVPEEHANHQAAVRRHHHLAAVVGRHAGVHDALLPSDGGEGRRRGFRHHHLVLHLPRVVPIKSGPAGRSRERNLQLPAEGPAEPRKAQQFAGEQGGEADDIDGSSEVHGTKHLSNAIATQRFERGEFDSEHGEVRLPATATQVPLSRQPFVTLQNSIMTQINSFVFSLFRLLTGLNHWNEISSSF